MCLVFHSKWMGLLHCSSGWRLVQVEVTVLWIVDNYVIVGNTAGIS